MSKTKEIGTRAETAVVKFLRATIFPDAERRTLSGKYDKGDVNAHRELVFEVKAVADPSFPGLLRETETERLNAAAVFGFLVHKPYGVGSTHTGVAKWTVALPPAQFLSLIIQADAAHLIHEVRVNTRNLKVHKAVAEANTLGLIVNPSSLFSVVSVKTNQNLEDFYAFQLRDLITLLARAGYGTQQ